VNYRHVKQKPDAILLSGFFFDNHVFSDIIPDFRIKATMPILVFMPNFLLNAL